MRFTIPISEISWSLWLWEIFHDATKILQIFKCLQLTVGINTFLGKAENGNIFEVHNVEDIQVKPSHSVYKSVCDETEKWLS